MKHYPPTHFEIPKQKEVVDWLSFLALALMVGCAFVWLAILT